MESAPRQPLRVHPAIAGTVIVLCLATIIVLVSFIVPFGFAAEAYLLVVILLGFRYWPPMGRWIGRMPIAHRVVLGLLLGGMIVGHFTLQTHRYFPFVAWEIFPLVREDNPVTCREFIATTASGKSVRLLVEQLFPSIVQFNLPDDIKDKHPGVTEHLARVLATAYNQRHRDDPVQRVDLVRLAVKLHPSESESPACELLKRYDISSARSN